MLQDLAAAEGKWNAAAFINPIKDFYLTNPIARSSTTMALLSKMRAELTSLKAAE